MVLPSERVGRGMPDLEKNPDRLLHELHIARKYGGNPFIKYILLFIGNIATGLRKLTKP